MSAKIFCRSGFPFNYDADKASDESGLKCEDKSLAQQSQRDESDINVIVKRFGVSGVLPQSVRVPLQADFIESMTFQEAQNALRAAQESFDKMPADVRARFNNDPGEFVDFCSDVDNLEEMRKMGLAVPAVVETVSGEASESGETAGGSASG